MGDKNYPESDPRHHTAKIKRMLTEAMNHCREDEGKITDEASAMQFLDTIRPEIVQRYEKGKPTTAADWVRLNCRFAQGQP